MEPERAAEQTRVPIIALTANAIKGVEQMFFNAGMNDFISKPIIANNLYRVLWNWLPPEKIKFKTNNDKNNEVHCSLCAGCFPYLPQKI